MAHYTHIMEEGVKQSRRRYIRNIYLFMSNKQAQIRRSICPIYIYNSIHASFSNIHVLYMYMPNNDMQYAYQSIYIEEILNKPFAHVETRDDGKLNEHMRTHDTQNKHTCTHLN